MCSNKYIKSAMHVLAFEKCLSIFEKPRSKDHFDIYYDQITGSLRVLMVARETSAPLASARLEVRVRKHQHEVRLGQRIILVCDMSI